jgi:hypothetical protein
MLCNEEGEKIEPEDTTIRLSKKTKKRVEKLGDFGQSWDDLLNDMADFIEDREEEWVEEEEQEEE